MIRTEDLYYFVTVVRTTSINSAALELDVTPPAISHALRKLENELNLPLLIRSSKGVEPTDAGKIIYSYAKEVIILIQTIESTADTLLHENTELELEQCIFFAEPSILDTFLPAISRRLYVKFPDIDLIIANKPIAESLSEIEEDPFCCSLVLLGSDVQKRLQNVYPRISQVVISSQKPIVIAKKNSKWLLDLISKTNGTLKVEDIVSLPYIATSWNSTSHYSFMNLLKKYGTPNIINLAPSISILGTYLENDIGITLGIHNIDILAANKKVVEISLDTHDDFTLDYVFLFNAESDPRLIQYLIKVVRDSFDEVQL